MNLYNLPKFKIPKVEYQEVFQSLSEVYDWSLVDLNIPEVHKSTMGENVHICIIDSGKSEHFEVQNNIVDSKNFTSSSTVNDKVSHSTFVSGLIAADANNEGIIGVAPKAKLYFAKSIDDSGAGNPAAMTNAVYWAIEKKVDIISISAGSFFDFKPLHEAVKAAYAKNIIMCCAVGNSGNRFANVAFPARYPECMGIAAYDHNKKVATFSSRGINVFCALPGVDIYSTSLNNGYSKANGTSFSTPLMAGICALILSKHRKDTNKIDAVITPSEMMEHLRKYSKKLNGNPNEVGFGTIDVVAAVN